MRTIPPYLAAIPEAVWLALIGLASTVFLGLLNKSTKNAVEKKSNEVLEKANIAATKSAEVKDDLAESQKHRDQKLEGLATVAKETHALVNSQHGGVLLACAKALRQVADLTNKPVDVIAAEAAEKAVEEHDAKEKLIQEALAKSIPTETPTTETPNP